MEQFSQWSSSCGILAALVLCYIAIDCIRTKRAVQEQPNLPLVGAPWPFIPRVFLNARFAWNAVGMLNEGYRKARCSILKIYVLELTWDVVQSNDRPFQIVQNDKNVIVLPHHLLQELSILPSSVASPHGGLELDLLGSYTGLDLVLSTRLHHSVIQRRLTPRLSLIASCLEKELVSALQDHLPSCEDGWVELRPFLTFRDVVSRLTRNLIIGPSFPHKEAWEKLQVHYVENCE